jgi:uncharacterized protein
MRGVDLLRQNGIDFHVIAVLSKASLKYAEEIVEFFRDIGVSRVGLNIEESEGEYCGSSITRDTEAEYREFLSKIDVLSRGGDDCKPLVIREFANMERSILWCGGGHARDHGEECSPFAIVTVDYEGYLSTFSPELHGNTKEDYSGFRFGNVLTDGFRNVTENPSFRLALHEIETGVSMCKRDCQYFGVCGGGSPSNKYYENGTFASTETTYCRHKIQIVAELVLRRMQQTLTHTLEAPA